jgi:hypothetical protein
VAPSIVNTWTASFGRSTGFTIPAPSAKSVAFNIANTGAIGNWLVAVIGWRQASLATPVTFTPGDTAGNVWYPLGAPNGTSPDTGIVRVSAWACPNPQATTGIACSPNGIYNSAAVMAAEISGLGPWLTEGSVPTGLAVQATSVGSLTSVPPTGAPLNANTLFTSATAPWAPQNAAAAWSSAWGYEVAGSVAITAQGTATPGVVSEMVPVSAGTTYTASFWAASVSAWAPGAQAVITWYNSSGGLISTTTGAAAPITAGQFARAFASAAAPSGSAFATMTAQLAGTPAAGLIAYASQPTIGPASLALFLTACATDLVGGGVAAPSGSGWTSFPQASYHNGTDSTSDIVLNSAWQVSSAAASAGYSSSSHETQDFASVNACVLVQGITPAAPNPNWPLVRTQFAPGAGVQTPWDQVCWTDISPRQRGMSGSRGKQYELDVIQAGTHNWTLANNDGALTPESELSPYFPFVTDYTPVRMLATWPPPPALNARTYSVVRHLMERWPQARTQSRYQNSGAVSTDAWASMTPQQLTIARTEMLLDNPVAVWPLDDAAGSTLARNIAPGGVGPIQLISSKYGTGSAIVQFQADSFIPGDPGGAGWNQSGLSSTTTQGSTLYSADPGLPPIAAGVTIDGWWQVAAGNPSTKLALFTVRNSKGNVCQLYVDGGTGEIGFGVYDRVTGTLTSYLLSAFNWLGAAPFHVMVTFNQTGWQAWVDGSNFGSASGSCDFANSPWWISYNGVADRVGTGAFYNGGVQLLGIYPQQLVESRAVAHYWSGITGVSGSDVAGDRIERLMGASGCAFPRLLHNAGDFMQGALDIQGQAVSQNVTNIAESDNGLLLVNGAGYVIYLDRHVLWNTPATWAFGENGAAPLNANSDFEGGTTAPWTPAGNATLAASEAWSVTGEWSALITPDGVTSGPGMQSEAVAVTAGVTYSASAWAYSPQGFTAGAALTIKWLAAGGSTISSAASATLTLAAGQPAQLTVTGRAPNGAVAARIVLAAAGTPAGTVQIFADDAAITTAATEYPYLADFATDHDPSQVFNDIELDQMQAPVTIGADATGVTIIVQTAESILQYGDQTLQETIYTTKVQAITDLANWIANTMGAPQTRIATMTLDPGSNPSLWPVVLTLETGMVIKVTTRLRGTVQLTGLFQVMTIGHATDPGSWKTTVTAVTFNGYVLACDDPVNGVLSGVPRLAW